MAGDLTLYTPGEKVSVMAVADADGAVPMRGQAVELADEANGEVQVALPAADATAVGHVARPPEEYDDDDEYDAGEMVGQTTLLLRHFVDWFETDDAFEPGDDVVFDADGGVRAFAGDTDDAGDVAGVVFTTMPYAAGTNEKVAVVRYR